MRTEPMGREGMGDCQGDGMIGNAVCKGRGDLEKLERMVAGVVDAVGLERLQEKCSLRP